MQMLPVSGIGVSVQRGREVSRYRITTAAATVSLRLDTNTGQPLLVEWGDGTSSLCASGATVSRLYAASYTGYVTVSAFSLATKTTRWESPSTGWSFNLAVFPKSIAYVDIRGSNTVTGDLSSIPLATYVDIQGSNTVTGDLSSLPLATYVDIRGSNTVTGDLSSLPLATYITITGSNTVTGDLSSIPLATYITITGSNTVTFSGVWTTTTMRRVYVRGNSNIDTSVIDNLLIALAATATTWTNEKNVNLKGSRTSASDAAVSTLQARGVSVTVN